MERPRRLRQSDVMRSLVRETHLRADSFIQPMFVRDIAEPVSITSMPGVMQHSFASLTEAVLRAKSLGVAGVMLFGVPADRDAFGTEACDANGILSRALRATRAAVGPDYILCADICLDEFTEHGHCGVLTADGRVDNDATLSHYADMAIVCAQAGANMVGLSGMMDSARQCKAASKAIAALINRIRPTDGSRCGKCASTSSKAPTS